MEIDPRLVAFAGLTAYIIKTQIRKPEEILKRHPNIFLRFKASGQPPELIRKIKSSAEKILGATEVNHLAPLYQLIKDLYDLENLAYSNFCVLNIRWTLLSFGYLIAIAAEPLDTTSSKVVLALYIKSSTNPFDGKVAERKILSILHRSGLEWVEVSDFWN
jgi:hypothetical protein